MTTIGKAESLNLENNAKEELEYMKMYNTLYKQDNELVVDYRISKSDITDVNINLILDKIPAKISSISTSNTDYKIKLSNDIYSYPDGVLHKKHDTVYIVELYPDVSVIPYDIFKVGWNTGSTSNRVTSIYNYSYLDSDISFGEPFKITLDNIKAVLETLSIVDNVMDNTWYSLYKNINRGIKQNKYTRVKSIDFVKENYEDVYSTIKLDTFIEVITSKYTPESILNIIKDSNKYIDGYCPHKIYELVNGTDLIKHFGVEADNEINCKICDEELGIIIRESERHNFDTYTMTYEPEYIKSVQRGVSTVLSQFDIVEEYKFDIIKLIISKVMLDIYNSSTNTKDNQSVVIESIIYTSAIMVFFAVDSNSKGTIKLKLSSLVDNISKITDIIKAKIATTIAVNIINKLKTRGYQIINNAILNKIKIYMTTIIPISNSVNSDDIVSQSPFALYLYLYNKHLNTLSSSQINDHNITLEVMGMDLFNKVVLKFKPAILNRYSSKQILINTNRLLNRYKRKLTDLKLTYCINGSVHKPSEYYFIYNKKEISIGAKELRNNIDIIKRNNSGFKCGICGIRVNSNQANYTTSGKIIDEHIDIEYNKEFITIMKMNAIYNRYKVNCIKGGLHSFVNKVCTKCNYVKDASIKDKLNFLSIYEKWNKDKDIIIKKPSKKKSIDIIRHTEDISKFKQRYLEFVKHHKFPMIDGDNKRKVIYLKDCIFNLIPFDKNLFIPDDDNIDNLLGYISDALLKLEISDNNQFKNMIKKMESMAIRNTRFFRFQLESLDEDDINDYTPVDTSDATLDGYDVENVEDIWDVDE